MVFPSQRVSGQGCPAATGSIDVCFAAHLFSEILVILAMLEPAWTLPFSEATALSRELLLLPRRLESTLKSRQL